MIPIVLIAALVVAYGAEESSRFIVEKDGDGWRVIDQAEDMVVWQGDTRTVADRVAAQRNRTTGKR